MTGKLIAFLLLTAFFLCGCSKLNRLPSSTGQPYEVVLEGDTDSIVTRMLTNDVPYLPQPEPMFNLIHVRKGKATSLYQMVRNRVVVDVDGRNAGFSMKVSKGCHAQPQCLVYIKAQTVGQLKDRLDGEKLCRVLDEQELKHMASVIKQNLEKQKEVKHQFGIVMKIPQDMDVSKKGKDFVWLSNNTNSGMKNLLVFNASNKTEIDSVLRQNMLGENDGMYMQLASVIPQKTRLGLQFGLWEMEGDAMGGPYVMRILPRGKQQVVVVGFVYAPEMKKRNLMKQLEAVLTTIK